MAVNATASLYIDGISSVDHSWPIPITSAPAMAPYGLPMPPRMAAEKIGMTRSQPMLG